jgi:hypothetical protein
MTPLARSEINALHTLTLAQCSSSPVLLGWQQRIQDETMEIQGGYIVFILMQKLDGVCPVNLFPQMGVKDQLCFKEKFKDAWL